MSLPTQVRATGALSRHARPRGRDLPGPAPADRPLTGHSMGRGRVHRSPTEP